MAIFSATRDNQLLTRWFLLSDVKLMIIQASRFHRLILY